MVAQSVGGRGGEAGTGVGLGWPVNIPGIGGDGGNGGTADSVTINSSGDVTTSGGNAHGIFALSQAGDGANGGNGTIAGVVGVAWGGDAGSGGNGGTVRVAGSGQVTSTNHNSDGILALSKGFFRDYRG